jgi:hypothetical protein
LKQALFCIPKLDAADATWRSFLVFPVLDYDFTKAFTLDLSVFNLLFELLRELEGTGTTLFFITEGEADEIAIIPDFLDRVFHIGLWGPPEIRHL